MSGEITVSFRQCVSGERVSDNQCVQCAAGTYSLVDNADTCDECMDHATCTGQDVIDVDDGYW